MKQLFSKLEIEIDTLLALKTADLYLDVKNINQAIVARRWRSWLELLSHAECWVFVSQLQQTIVVKTGSDTSFANRSTVGVCGSMEVTIIYECPTECVARYEPSQNNGHEFQVQVKNCSPSPEMGTSLFERKI